MKRKSSVVERLHGFSIRKDGSGFIIQVRRKGLSETKWFADLDAAKLHITTMHAKQMTEGASAFSLTPRQRHDATDALALLENRASLVAAAHAWLRLNPATNAATVQQLFDRAIDSLTARGKRASTIQCRRQFLARFAKDYGTRPASSIIRDEVEEWLNTRVPLRSFNTLRMSLHAAFAFAVKMRLIDTNPVSAIDPKTFDSQEPTFWPAKTVESILRAAQTRDTENAARMAKLKRPPKSNWLPLTPYLVLQALAGLRPFEAQRLDWSAILLKQSCIRLPAAASKVRRARLIPLEPVAVKWLALFQCDAGPVAPSLATVRRIRKSFLATAKLAPVWPQDQLRHSFATHWMALHSHEGRLAEILGNSPAIVQRHYKGLATKKEGAKYFALNPA